ncbi:MAG TPA: hypothetical protein VLF89_10095 [Candidatus Saccharimonadales bacterium]|nr:hypothetical protein [Candidatus Saccharimonadales bacterium]
MNLLLAFLIPILSFILQSYPRLFNKLFGVDVWTRLLETEHIRKNHHTVPNYKLEDQFIIDGYFDYPPVFPTLLSFFPKKTLLHIQGFVAPFFDALQVLLVYYVTYYLTGNVQVSLLAQLMYMMTPMIAIENSYLTPRSLGYLNFTLAVLPLVLYYYSHQPIFFLLGIIFTFLLFLTHRFAIQSFFFIMIFFTFFLNTPIFFQSFVIGFALALLITKGYYLRVLKGHLYNIYFWVKNLDYRFAHQIRGISKKSAKKDLIERIYQFLTVFSPIAVFGLNPWSLSGFLIPLAFYFALLPVSPILLTLAAWILFFYVLGVVVLKTKQLMPIGEGQRYMEMATVPSSILSSYIFFQLLNTQFKTPAVIILVALLLFTFVLIIVIQIKGVIKDRNRSITEDLVNIFEYINKQKDTMRIVCIPHQNTTMTVYHTKAQVLVNADNPGLMRIQDVYPILRMPVKELAKKYHLTHALVKESFATLKELGLSQKDVIFSSGDVLLVQL